MTNNELLLEISNMMDVKIGTLHQTVRDEMKEMENNLHGEITGLKNEMRSEISGMKSEISGMQNEISGIKNEISGMKSEISGMKSEISGMKSEMSGMKADIRALKMQNENDIIPRLQNIESCYLDTSKRFYMELGQMEDLKQDVDVLKKVVAEHSEQLRKIS